MTLPNTYIVGQIVLLSDLIANPTTNVPVADSTDVVTVYKPDGTTVEPIIVHPGQDNANAYDAQVTVDQPGWWEYVFQSTGAGAGAGRKRFYVSPVP